MSKLPEAEREVNEIDVLEKLATIYAAPGDPRCEEAYEALVALGPTMDCSMGRCARSSPGHFPLCGPVPSNGAWKLWNRHLGLAPAKEMRSCEQGYLPKGRTH